MRNHTSYHEAKRKKGRNSLLDERLEYARQRVEPQQPPDLTQTALPDIMPLDTLLATPLPAPRWIIPDLLPVGVTLLTGVPHVGKSWLAMRLALATATATPVLECNPLSQGHVLYLDLEGNLQRVQARAAELLHNQNPPHTLEWAGNWLSLNAGGLADIEDWLDNHPQARVVVIDSLASVHAREERGYSGYPSHALYRVLSRQDATIMIPLKVIADMHHVAILVILHLYKTLPADCSDELRDILRSTPEIASCMLLLKQEPPESKTILRLMGQNVAEKEWVL